MITISISQRQVIISRAQQALAKAATSRRNLQLHLQQDLNPCLVDYGAAPAINVHEDYSDGDFLAPGYPPLFYNRREGNPVSPSKSAIAGIGEGVAGFLAQRLYRCRSLARPIQDYPDIVMDTPDSAIYLVESKASTGAPASLLRTIDAEVIRLASYASACSELNNLLIRGLLIATAFVGNDQYQTYVTEVLI